MADKRISQLIERVDIANNDVLPIVASGATTTNKVTISTVQDWMQENLDLGVTSVGITLGSSGTDVSVTGSPITSSGNITINLPTASATNRGLLSAADWSTFNSKQDTLTNPVTGTGAAGRVAYWNGAGTITSDSLFQWNDTFNRLGIGKTPSVALDVDGAGFFSSSVTANSLIKTGGTSVQYLMADGSTSTLTNPITGTLATGQVAFGTAANTVGGSNNLFYDNANVKLGIGTNTPEATGLTVAGGGIIVSLDSTAARKVLELYATSTGAKVSSTYVGASSYGSLELLTSNTPRLTISSIGAATFSSGIATLGYTASTSYAALFNGNVGIGTTAPTNGKLEVQQSTTTAALWVQTGGTTASHIIADFRTGTNLSALQVQGNGNSIFSGSVGIGTASPIFGSVSRLTVGNSLSDGGITIQSSSTGISRLIFAKDDTSGVEGLIRYLHSDNSMQFWTAADLRMRITSTGNVLIGTTTDTGYKLKVQGSTFSEYISIENNSAPTILLQCWNKSNIGDNKFVEFYTEGGGGALRGSIDYNRAAGLVRYNVTSDANLKNLIGDSDKSKSIAILNSTRIREYSWKEDETNKSQIGVIAQELHQTFKGAVSVGSDEELLGTEEYKPWAVDKTAFTFHLVAGFQEHEKIIKELQEQINQLKNQMQ